MSTVKRPYFLFFSRRRCSSSALSSASILAPLEGSLPCSLAYVMLEYRALGIILLSLITYGLSGIPFADLSLGVDHAVVMMGRVTLLGLTLKLIGNRAAILGVEVLVAVRLASGVTGFSLLSGRMVLACQATGCDVGFEFRHCDMDR